MAIEPLMKVTEDMQKRLNEFYQFMGALDFYFNEADTSFEERLERARELLKEMKGKVE